MKKQAVLILLLISSMMIFDGCQKKSTAQQAPLPEETEEYPEEYGDEEFEDEEYYEDEYFDEEDEFYGEEPLEEEYPEEAPAAEAASDKIEKARDDSAATGVWYTDGYDEEGNWALSYKIELTADGKASCTGWRNKDTGTYETKDGNVLITFDHCETETPGEGFAVVDGFKYTIDMTINGDDARIKINAPDVISNLEDGTLHRQSGSTGSEEGDAGEGVNIADGEYITDETYKGDISADGATVTIETALSHYDKDWNTVLDYEKSTYVFSTSKGCKCVIYQETEEEYPVAEQVGFINDFLKGNSGLPITLKIKNNELIEIGFSS